MLFVALTESSIESRSPRVEQWEYTMLPGIWASDLPESVVFACALGPDPCLLRVIAMEAPLISTPNKKSPHSGRSSRDFRIAAATPQLNQQLVSGFRVHLPSKAPESLVTTPKPTKHNSHDSNCRKSLKYFKTLKLPISIACQTPNDQIFLKELLLAMDH